MPNASRILPHQRVHGCVIVLVRVRYLPIPTNAAPVCTVLVRVPVQYADGCYCSLLQTYSTVRVRGRAQDRRADALPTRHHHASHDHHPRGLATLEAVYLRCRMISSYFLQYSTSSILPPIAYWMPTYCLLVLPTDAYFLLPIIYVYCLVPSAYHTAYCLLPTVLPTAYILPTVLPTTVYCLLPTAYCLLPTAYCLLPTADCRLPCLIAYIVPS